MNIICKEKYILFSRKYVTFSELPLRSKEAITVTFVPNMDNKREEKEAEEEEEEEEAQE